MAALDDGGIVGGITEIKDVKSNKEIQDLGKYCVEKNNSLANGNELTFSAVVKAEEQVVAGIRYYLTIEATQNDGVLKRFDADVVVQPWMKSKELLRFVPSSN
ncbi:Cystatin domain [Dillenia turbinata]|uniref:Cystatin domain n=1 Tax=Dillenia turbinata TaxID=194707 RepID=A0AAN8YYN4_9MAGN